MKMQIVMKIILSFFSYSIHLFGPEAFHLDYLLGSLIIGSFNEPDNSKTIDLPLRGRI